MKVYISADIEGTCGITDTEHTKRDGKDYALARTLMTLEVNAAAEGAFQGGATEVVVNDAHGTMNNLLLGELHEKVRLLSGSPKPLSMLQGVDGCDCAFFVGYHACAGTPHAILDHTYNGRVVYNVRVNGTTLGELGLNAYLAGYFGVPVVLVSGDRKVVEEASHLLKGVDAVVTKEGVGRRAAVNRPPGEVREELRKKAQKAVESKKPTPLKMNPPFRLELDVIYTNMADAVEMMPGVERVSGRCLAYECGDFLTLYRAMRSMILVASTTL